MRDLDDETGAFMFADIESGKLIVFCGDTAAYVEFHRRDRFALPML